MSKLKITPPPMPVFSKYFRPRWPGDIGGFEESQIAARDAQWIERVRPLVEALLLLRDRLADHPEYAELTEEEEMDIGGDTAEFSFLVREATAALAAIQEQTA